MLSFCQNSEVQSMKTINIVMIITKVRKVAKIGNRYE